MQFEIQKSYFVLKTLMLNDNMKDFWYTKEITFFCPFPVSIVRCKKITKLDY